MAASDLRLPRLLQAYLAAWTVTIAAALVVRAVPGAPHAVAAWLRESLSAQDNPPPTPSRALRLVAHNLQIFAVPFVIAAAGVGRHGRMRLIVDIGLSVDFLIQTSLVGIAIGAYGPRIATFLPHLPFEWLGLAAGYAAWLTVRDDPDRRAAKMLRLGGVLMISLVVGGVLEIYATPHR